MEIIFNLLVSCAIFFAPQDLTSTTHDKNINLIPSSAINVSANDKFITLSLRSGYFRMKDM